MTAKLIGRRLIAENTTEITLDLQGQPFVFKAGQYVNLCFETLPHADPRGTCREFSISSSPREEGILRTAFRNSHSGFKRSMLSAPLGTDIAVDGPFGLFTIPKRQINPVVCIAGGIGVTPFMGIVKTMMLDKNPLGITLITSNSTTERAPFREELKKLQKENRNFTLHENIGHLTAEFIKASVGDMQNPIYYLAGPPKMIHDIREALKSTGVDDDDILAEEFVGYE
jgi:ferredoxin-NADP reductase